MTSAEPAGLVGAGSPRRIRVPHLLAAKQRGERWPMLTAYDQHTAGVFEAAGIPVLLVGDSAANNVFGYQTTVQLSLDELIVLAAGVTRSVRRPLVVGDLTFGSYQASAEQALGAAVRMMAEGGVQAVKFEGGRRVVPQVDAVVGAGIPVMAHIGFTPQSEHALGGYRVQGRGERADELVKDAIALQNAGAFAVVLELVPAATAKRITEELSIPTVGIGAGPHCDAQVLVWTDLAGMSTTSQRFVKRYADMRGVLGAAAEAYAADVRAGVYPDADHSFS